MISDTTLNRLEFYKVLQAVSRLASSEVGARAVLSMRPLSCPKEIRVNFKRIEEIRELIRQRISLRISRFSDIRPLLDYVRPNGAILPTDGLLEFIPVLGSLAELERQLVPREDIPALKLLSPFPVAFDDILEPLSATLDEEGNILDSASRELAEIRKAKRTLATRVRKKLEDFVRRHETAIFLQDDFITIRSGRWVIPVRMDSKGMIAGVVHDVSSSGETAFMEPLEIIPFVNELENLSAEEKAEEIRILRQISAWIREDAEQIRSCFNTLVELDRLNSLAVFAEKFSMSVPELNQNGLLRISSARHPLLLVIRADNFDTTVVQPLDLELDHLMHLLVISGPNAGGKTIALKTVGLVTAMALSGMPVPASASSSIPLFDSILVDIGDEQSIEHSLSTFSAHAAAAAEIMAQAGPKSLVLLDELGTGTEPLQGAAIGCGILNELKKLGATVLATTHLTEIVGFVQSSAGMQNAGMEFETDTWTPLYRLVMGEPGQSHALETAKRYGLPESVLKFASDLLGDAGTAFADVIEELRQKRKRLAEELTLQKSERKILEQRESELRQQKAELDILRQETIDKARKEARDLVSAARCELNNLLEQFRKERRQETADRLRERASQLDAAFAPPEQQPPDPAELKPGSIVHVRSLNREASVVSIDRARQKIRVRTGSIEMEVPLHGIQGKPVKNNLQKIAYKGMARLKTGLSVSDSLHQVVCHSELNLLGKRADEALSELEGFIDQAVLAGLTEIRIIHGLGSGTLRQVVREALGRHPQVTSFRSGEPHEGRDGATVAELSY